MVGEVDTGASEQVDRMANGSSLMRESGAGGVAGS